MEPNQNMQNSINDPEVTINNQPEAISVRQEPVTAIQNKQSMIHAPMEKKRNGMLAGLILCIILAIGGVGFGGYEMISSNQKIADLKNEITALKAAQIVDESEDGEFLYVGEWGLKIKIPEELVTLSYEYVPYKDDSASLIVAGAIEGEFAYPEFASIEGSFGMAKIMRVPVDFGFDYGEVIFSDDEYEYVYSGDLPLVSEGEELRVWEEESAAVVEGMLSNVENYSEI